MYTLYTIFFLALSFLAPPPPPFFWPFIFLPCLFFFYFFCLFFFSFKLLSLPLLVFQFRSFILFLSLFYFFTYIMHTHGDDGPLRASIFRNTPLNTLTGRFPSTCIGLSAPQEPVILFTVIELLTCPPEPLTFLGQRRPPAVSSPYLGRGKV